MTGADFTGLSLSDLVDLRERISRELKQRFERPVALMFTDVVGSTAYLSEHGDVAGTALLQRHHRLLEETIAGTGARIVDTAGDGAFLATESAVEAAWILVDLQRRLLEDNAATPEPDRLAVRSGLHWGPALVDDQQVTGESVHTAARIAGCARAGEIRLSVAAYESLPVPVRLSCSRLEPQRVKGIPDPVEMLLLDWRDPQRFPTLVEIVETGQVEPIPTGRRVGFGRLAEHLGEAANDIVLTLADDSLTQRISRRHLELEMTPEGYLARALSRALTEVDGQPLAEGQTARLRPGSIVRLGGVLTLRFPAPSDRRDATLLEPG
jgi:class 3 adenylate cyclase